MLRFIVIILVSVAVFGGYSNASQKKQCHVELVSLTINGNKLTSQIDSMGQIKNVSGKPLTGITAIATIIGKSGHVIGVEEGPVTYTDIAPGETSPFKVTAYFVDLNNVEKVIVKFKTPEIGKLQSCSDKYQITE